MPKRCLKSLLRLRWCFSPSSAKRSTLSSALLWFQVSPICTFHYRFLSFFFRCLKLISISGTVTLNRMKGIIHSDGAQCSELVLAYFFWFSSHSHPDKHLKKTTCVFLPTADRWCFRLADDHTKLINKQLNTQTFIVRSWSKKGFIGLAFLVTVELTIAVFFHCINFPQGLETFLCVSNSGTTV